MTNAKREGNRITTMMGVSDSDLTTLLPLRSDPSTERLLVELVGTTDVGSLVISNVKRDEDRRTTLYGVTDDSNLSRRALVVDHQNKYLYVDLLIE